MLRHRGRRPALTALPCPPDPRRDLPRADDRAEAGRGTVDQQTRTSTLPSGLRVATCTVPHARSLAAVLRLAAGARHDPPGHAGLAHLVEHAAASGTAAHPTARALAGLVERVGGWTDAATEAEATIYRASVP